MQLVSIETTNFKKLRRFKAEFTGGLNVIVGDNAQGKTTLLQAIECALYGSTVVPGKKDKIPTWGQSSWKVVLLFAFGEEEYRLTRSKSTAKLERGDELVANGNTPVTAEIAELLDLDAKDYNLFMQSKQGETSGVLTFGAAALNRKVEAFAGISLIDRVQSLAQEEFRTAKAKAEALEVDQEKIDEAKQEVTALGDAALDLEKDVKEAQEELDALPRVDDLEKPEGDPDVLEGRLRKINQLRGRQERAELEVKHAEQRYQDALQRFEELDEPKAGEDLEEQVKTLRGRMKDAVAEVNRLQRELNLQEQLWVDLEKAEKAMDDCTPEDEITSALDHELEQQTARHDERRAEQHRVVEINQQIKQLKSLRDDANCPTCGTKLSEHDPEKLAEEIEQLEAEKEKHNRAWDELTGACQAIDEQVKKLQDGLSKGQAAEEKVDELRERLVGKDVNLQTAESPVEAQLSSAKEVYERLLAEKANLEHSLDLNEGQWRQYRRAQKAVNTEKASLEEFTEELEEIEGQLAAGEAEGVPTQEEIQQLRRDWDQYLADSSERKMARMQAQQELERRNSELNQAIKAQERQNDVLARLLDSISESRKHSKDADKASRLSRFLRERRSGYLQEVWDAVLAASSKQVAMASKGMISRLVYDDGDFLFEEEGILAPVASASGAQKAHIGVALRIGLSRALYGSDALIIFDEPTESMSEHHAAGLSASLAGAAQQCLLITHREQDQDLAANVIEVAA